MKLYFNHMLPLAVPALLASSTGYGQAAPDAWVPEMYNCGTRVFQFICTVSDTENSISTCRPDRNSAAEDAWRRFTDDFGAGEKTKLTCKKLW